MENRANKIYKSSNETYKELKQQVAMLKEQLKDLQEKQTRKETNTLGSPVMQSKQPSIKIATMQTMKKH